jgi:hypothetical protein
VKWRKGLTPLAQYQNGQISMCSEQIAELVNYTKIMDERLFGVTTTEIRSLAYELCKTNGSSKPFRSNNEMVGVDWPCGLPDISLRKPEYTSVAPAKGFNKFAVSNIFDLLTKVIDDHRLTPDRIYNVDER